jgi:hypothetical protein
MLKKCVSVLLVLAFVFAIGSQFNPNTSYDVGYSNGKRDGRADASWLWAFAGLGCNCLGAAVAYFVPGDVPTEMIIGQDPNYARGYADSYIKAKRWRQVMWAAIGMIINSAIAGAGASSAGA